jgi:AraC-like DNA-binding protein
MRKMMFATTAHFLIAYYKAVCNLSMNAENASGGRSYQILSRFYSLISEQSPLTERGSQYYADRLNISVRHLFKICKTEAHQTPKDIINEFLTGEIQNTLLTTDLSIQELTDRFSFPDPTAFGQFFKRQTGMTPGEFRKKY